MLTDSDLDQLVPGGIKNTDFLHRRTYDETCSRCRQPVTDNQVPLLLWVNDNHDMWSFCETCLGLTEERCSKV